MQGDGAGLYNKLQGYQNKLLQLTASNRCICIRKLYSKHSFDLSRLLEGNSKQIDELVRQSFKRKKPVCILPDSDDSEKAVVMRRHLKTLSRNIKQSEDETGSQYCYFGFPFLEGHVTAEYYVRGPLALFPISIYYGYAQNKMGWCIKFLDQNPIYNHTLFTALEKLGNYKVQESFESDFEDMVTSLTITEFEAEFTQKILQLLKNNRLPISPPDPEQESSDDASSFSTPPLRDMTKVNIEDLEKKPLRIIDYKIVGSFPQGDSAIYHDYESLISKVKNGESSDFIADLLAEMDTPPKYAESDNVDIEDLDGTRDVNFDLILPSDSSQDKVVLASQHEKITIVRGPPGTGKSQVIVNIIANALSKGQKILVVCQKRTALEVVHQRLGEKNLDQYTVLLNKEKEDRAKMYHQIKQILDKTGSSARYNHLQLQSVSDDIDRLIIKHSKIFRALSKEYFGGTTIRDLYANTSSDYARKLDLGGIVDRVQSTDLGNFLYSISQIEDSYKKFEDDGHPWKNRKDFAGMSAISKNKIREILSGVLTKAENCVIFPDRQKQGVVNDLVKKHASLKSDLKEIEAKISKCTESIRAISNPHNTPIPLANLDELINCVNAGMILWDRFRDYDRIIQITKDRIVMDDYTEQTDLLEAFSNPAEKTSFWKKLTNSEAKRKDKLKKEFDENPDNSAKTHGELKGLLENGLELWNAARDHQGLKKYIFEKAFLLNDDGEQGHLLKELRTLNDLRIDLKHKSDQSHADVKSMQELFGDSEIYFDRNEDVQQLVLRITNGAGMIDQVDSLSEFVTDAEISAINAKLPDIGELVSHIRNLNDSLGDFDMLQSYDIKKSDLSDDQRAILGQCLSVLSKGEDWNEIIRQEIYHHWIEAIEQDNLVLREGFGDYKQNQERLASLMEKKSDLIVEKIIDAIETHANFKPGMGNRRTKREVEYSELNHQLGRKRNVKPVRKIFEEFEHILLDIVPCWLASPDMVSNIFPLEENMFDLVIVDEASQLAAERALPFLYRGERIVIAGDEKQLKPHDLFQIKGEEDEEEYEEINIESLLMLAKKRGYTHITLQWHYRSKWQELIDFSNHAFYNDMLQVSPNAQIKTPSPPIEWVDCPKGMWENRANVTEAAKVTDVLYEILQKYDGRETPTIGMITFNISQKEEILNRIDAKRKEDPVFDQLYGNVENPASGRKDDEVFVRPIENVQGDERDIIIFSVGYAKDFEGKFRLQFGSLSGDGGENRLNVAITRASKKIIVVCSIDPRDMKVDSTKNPGPKRLKDFLMYANAVSNGDKDRIKQILESLSSGMNTIRQRPKHFDSEFEELVHDRLEAEGYSVNTQVGQSGYRIDLAIVHPNDSGRYVLGIECDGAMFHSGKSVRERDVTRQQFLERRGWKIDRIWSRSWWKNPSAEIQRIKKKVESLLQEDSRAG